MFNIYCYEKKKSFDVLKQREIAKLAQIKDQKRLYHEKLLENYSKRISDFILHMEKQPIKLNFYKSPIKNAGRVTDPSKFKGKPNIITREHRRNQERLKKNNSEENIRNQSINSHFSQSKKEFPTINISLNKHLNTKTMYFKPKNSLERVVDKLKAQQADLDECKDNNRAKILTNKLNNRVSLHNFSADLQNYDKESDEPDCTEIQPKVLFAGLPSKTYFKAVTSWVVSFNSKTVPKLNPEADAEEVLINCNVKPTSHSNFLRSGGGKLVSNPEETVKATYTRLKRDLNM